MSKESGKGRAANLTQRRNHADNLSDYQMAEASKPTAQPRPEWMDRPELLPKAPPSRPRIGT